MPRANRRLVHDGWGLQMDPEVVADTGGCPAVGAMLQGLIEAFRPDCVVSSRVGDAFTVSAPAGLHWCTDTKEGANEVLSYLGRSRATYDTILAGRRPRAPFSA